MHKKIWTSSLLEERTVRAWGEVVVPGCWVWWLASNGSWRCRAEENAGLCFFKNKTQVWRERSSRAAPAALSTLLCHWLSWAGRCPRLGLIYSNELWRFASPWRKGNALSGCSPRALLLEDSCYSTHVVLRLLCSAAGGSGGLAPGSYWQALCFGSQVLQKWQAGS